MTATVRDEGTRSASYRPDVEGMRAVAVLLVVAFHAGWGLFSGGFVGVDVFFVLSGFLITGLLAGELTATGGVSFARFYGRRARRLLPMSTVVLIATAIAFSFVVSPIDRSTVAGDIKAAALYVANWHFAAGSLDYMSDPNKSPVLHYWSLAVEEQFYVVWPLLLVLVARRRGGRHVRRDAARRMTLALAAVAVVSLILSAVTTSISEPFAYYGLHTRAWELAAGGLLALGADRVRALPQAVRGLAGWIGLGLVLISALAMSPDTTFPGVAAVVPVAGAVLLVASGMSGAMAGVGRLLAVRPLTYIGRISYAWYLWHWPCLIFAGMVVAHGAAEDGPSGVLPHGFPALLAVAVSFGLSAASHRYLEDPVRRSRWLAAVRHRSLALGAALTTTALGAVGVVLPAASATAEAGPVVAVVAGDASPVSSSAPKVSRSVERITLQMSPERARADAPGDARGCYVGYTTTRAPAHCLFGDPSGRTTVVLVGDSHAQQWFPALDRIARNRHWRLWVWTKSACPLVDLEVHLYRFQGHYPSCTAWRGSVLDRIAALGHVDAVVVSHYGELSTEMSDAHGGLLSMRDVGPAWQRGWAHVMARLRAVASHVVLIRDVPHPSTDVPACLASHGRDVRPCSFSHASAFADADVVFNAERAVPHTQVVDLTDVLCPGATCPVVWRDGNIIYRDSHHLTATVSRDLAAYLGPRLARAIAP